MVQLKLASCKVMLVTLTFLRGQNQYYISRTQALKSPVIRWGTLHSILLT